MKIWTCGSSPRSGSWNAWTRIKYVNGASRPNDFLSRLLTMDETWLYHYDLETKQQSMEWRHSGSAHPKKFRVYNPLENFSPRFFGIKTASSSLIIFQRAKLSTRSITHLCCCNWRTFEGKTLRKGHQGGLVLTRQFPGSPGTCNPEIKWPTWASNVLITHPVLRIWPRRTTTCSLDWKSNWKIAIFRSTRRSLLPRRRGWTDNFLNFFECLAKVGATG